MKGAVEHRVPLPTRAIAILERLAEHASSDFVFPGHRSGRAAGATAMVRLARDLGIGATIRVPLGFSRLGWRGNGLSA